jgi:MFS family permease
LLGFLAYPEIKNTLQLSDGHFGLVLLASTVGSIPGAQIAGRAVHMHSSKLIVQISGVLLPIGVFVVGSAESVQTLVFGLFICGFNVSFMDIAINGQAVEIEKHTSGRWMSSFHGLWSIGAFSATLVGGLIAKFVSPKMNLYIIATFGLFAFQIAAHYLLPKEFDGHLGEPGEESAGKVALFWKAVTCTLGTWHRINVLFDSRGWRIRMVWYLASRSYGNWKRFECSRCNNFFPCHDCKSITWRSSF